MNRLIDSALSHRISQFGSITTSVKQLRVALFGFIVLAGASAFGQTPSAAAPASKAPPPKTWVDSETGHRVTRLSDVPHTYGLPFNKPAFTADGRDMIYVSSKAIYDLDLSTLKSRVLVKGSTVDVLVGTKTRTIFYRLITMDTAADIRAMNLDTGVVRVIGMLPIGGVLGSVNADETLIAGTALPSGPMNDFMAFKIKEDDKYRTLDNQTGEQCVHHLVPCTYTPQWAIRDYAMHDRFEAQIPEYIFTINIATGKLRKILEGTDWLGDVQFSPTDPELILFSHEGPATLVDRVWTMHADGSHKQLIHTRTDKTEAQMHEFWSSDGKTIWFGLERPTRANPFLVGYDVASGQEKYLHLARNEASLHFSQSADGNLFAGGGRNNKPDLVPNTKQLPQIGEESLNILQPAFTGSVSAAKPDDPSSFRSEKLVNLTKNNYINTDPNTRFSPDGKLVIFTSDMFGPRYVFAVEVNK